MKKLILVMGIIFFLAACSSEEITTATCVIDTTDMIEIAGTTTTYIEARNDEIFRFTVLIEYNAQDFLDLSGEETIEDVVVMLRQIASLGSVEGYSMEIGTSGDYITFTTLVDFDVLASGEFAEVVDFGDEMSLTAILEEYKASGASCTIH